MFTYPIIYSAIFILYYPYSSFYEERFFIPLAIFFSMLSSNAIEALVEERNIPHIELRLNMHNLKIRVPVRKIIAFTLIFLAFFSMFYIYAYNQYFANLNKMKDIDPVSELHMKPTVEWMINSTPKNAIFMNPNPAIYAWFADRHVVIARDLNVTQLYKIIKEFQVNYIIIDLQAAQYLPEVYGFVRRNWTFPLPGFSLVFYQQYFSDIPEVLIYNVSSYQNSKAENWTWKDEMLNSSDWHFYSGVGLYEWKFENGILNMSMTLNSTHDEYFMIQRELPANISMSYSSTLKISFRTYGQAVHFGIEAYDSGNNCLGRIISWTQITDWYTLGVPLPNGATCIKVFLDDVPDSAATGTLTALIDWIEITGIVFTNSTTG